MASRCGRCSLHELSLAVSWQRVCTSTNAIMSQQQQQPPVKKVSVESAAAGSCGDSSQLRRMVPGALRFLFRLAQLQAAWPYTVNDDGSANLNGKLLCVASAMIVYYGLGIVGLVAVIVAAVIDDQPYVNIIVSMSFAIYLLTAFTNVSRALCSKRQVAGYLPKLTAIINNMQDWNSNRASEESCSCHERAVRSSPRKIFGKTICIYILSAIASMVPMIVPIIAAPGAVHSLRAIFAITGPASVVAVQAMLPVTLVLVVGANYSVICILTAVILYVSQAFQDISVTVHTLLVTRTVVGLPGGGPNSCNALKSISARHLYLSRFVGECNDMFGGYLLSFYANALIQSLCCTYYLVYLLKTLTRPTAAAASVSVTAWDLLFLSSFTLQVLATCFLFTFLFASFSTKVHDIDIDLYDIAVNDKFTRDERKLASQLVRRLNGKPVVISANYFDVNKSLVLTILSVYLTYILVLLQVDN